MSVRNRRPRVRRALRSALATVAVAATVAACGGGAAGDGGDGGDGGGEESPFAGEDLDFVVPYDPGGGYDSYARAIAPYLEECLGARVAVRNEPGAGGLLATNKTASSPASANRIQIVNTVGLASAEMADAEGAQFELADLAWVGRVSSPPNVLVVGNDSGIESFQDVVDAQQPVRFVAQGPGANDYTGAYVLSEAYGYPYKIISGFAGSTEARTAVVAGDADAHVLPIDSQLSAIEAGDVQPIVTIDEEANPLLPDTPTVFDAVPPPNEESQEILDSLVAMGQLGRAVIAPSETDEERLAALREGFECAINDEDLVAELEKQERPLNPLGGEETAKLVQRVVEAPQEFRDLVKQSF